MNSTIEEALPKHDFRTKNYHKVLKENMIVEKENQDFEKALSILELQGELK